MGLISNLVGTPKEHENEKKDHEVVKAPEFDITQYAKKLGITVGIIVAAVVAALKAANVEEMTDPAVLVGVLAVVAAALLSVSFVMAVDLASRAYLTGEGSAASSDGSSPSDTELIPAPPGTMVWLEGDAEPHPVLAITGEGEKMSYLVAGGAKAERTVGTKTVDVVEGSPKWQAADTIRAVKPAKWP